MTAFWIVTAVLLVIIIFLFVPAVLEFDIAADGKDVKTHLVLKFLFVKIKLSPKNKKNKKKKASSEQKKSFSFKEAKNIFSRCRKIYNECKTDFAMILKYAAVHAVKIKKIDLNVKFDFENPMETGIAVGAANAVVYNILAVIDNAVGIKEMNVNIQPLFYNSRYFNGKFSGIVIVKNVHIMVILIKSLKVYFKIKKIV